MNVPYIEGFKVKFITKSGDFFLRNEKISTNNLKSFRILKDL